MPGAATPPNLLAAIASAAGGSYITDPMPESPTGSNAASVLGGFPPVTMESELAGGLPPLGQDMNGLFFLLSSHTLYVECGQLYLYNSTLATAIGGYAVGTVLGMSDGTGMWLNVTAGNTTNPDTGGAGWVPMASYGYANVTGLTGGAVSLTTAQSRRGVIVLSGTLVSNLTLTLPATVQEWLIINNTTGAFSTTATAGGANTVPIPQGGFAAPTPIYGIGDTNLYLQVQSASLPSYSQSPTGSTLVQRTSAGYVLATYFNSSASPSENPAIGSVAVMSTAFDGYIRFATLANFLSQLGFTSSIAQNGYIKLPGGLVVQWGYYNGATHTTGPQNYLVAYPIPFPNAALVGVVTYAGPTAGNSSAYCSWANNSASNFYAGFRDVSNEGLVSNAYWIAIGY